MKKLLLYLIALSYGLSLYGQNSLSKTFALEYEGEASFATTDIEARYLGEYIQDKGKSEQQFFIKIDKEESYLLRKNKSDAWDLEQRNDIEWAFLSNAEGKPLVFKVQEYADGVMQNFPAMVFLYRSVGTEAYNSKMLILRNGNLFLDEAPKQNSVAAQ